MFLDFGSSVVCNGNKYYLGTSDLVLNGKKKYDSRLADFNTDKGIYSY